VADDLQLPWDAARIQRVLPHRYPFLLVDRLLELEPGVRAVGLKQVTVNEPFFPGHFPGLPVMPGVLIVEALAQVGALALLSQAEYAGQIVFFAGIDGVRFRRPVVPGDSLRLSVTLTRLRGRVGKGRGEAHVADTLVAAGEFTFAIAPASGGEAMAGEQGP
jgi:3-hydroxyacyl-[acyl-carrier-protein] dehydratase